MDAVFESNIEAMIERYLSWSKINSGSPRTYKSHRISMTHFREFLQEDKINTLSHDVYEKYKEWLLDRNSSPRTVDLHLTAIGGIITMLEKHEIVPRGYFPRPQLIRKKKSGLPTFWTEKGCKNN